MVVIGATNDSINQANDKEIFENKNIICLKTIDIWEWQ